MITRLTILLVLLLQIFIPVFADEMILEIIPLRHRMVNEVITIIRPLVVEGGTVTGMNNQLIVKTTSANLSEIKQVLDSIDQSPRKLIISVKQGITGNTRINKDAVSASYSSNHVGVTAGESRSRGSDTAISIMDDDNKIQYQTRNSQSRQEDINVFRVQTMEGSPAYIAIGQLIPIPNLTTYLTPSGIVVRKGIDYHDATSGFYVLPRIQGNQVTLFISPRLSRGDARHSAAFDYQNIETTINGRVGEWITIGNVDQASDSSSRQNLNTSSRSNLEQRAILVKVDEIK